MFTEIISWAAVALILISVTAILIAQDWRISLGALGVAYLAAFLLVIRHLPIAMGTVKLISGWMVVATLGMTRLGLDNSQVHGEDAFESHGQWFKVFLIGIVTIIATGAAFRIEAQIPGIGLPVVAGGVLLIGAGVAHLGVTTNLLRVTIGLLTVLAGFEIMYAAVESAILVTGLLAVVNLGLGILGSYLMSAGSTPVETEEDLTL
jgi:hypothetical protein